MTERLRQWHFQLLVRKGSEIEALLGQPTPKSLETFKAERKKLFDGFLHDFVGKLDSRMDTLANDPDFGRRLAASTANKFQQQQSRFKCVHVIAVFVLTINTITQHTNFPNPPTAPFGNS